MMRSSIYRTAQLGLLARDFTTIKKRKSGPKRDQALKRIVERLGLMHGLPQKIGQLLAFSEIDSSDKGFTQLTENETEQSTAEDIKKIEAKLGGDLSNLFLHFETRSISASIGRVHRAILKDGRAVAVKVQHPGVSEAVDYDLKALGWLTSPIGGMKRNFDMGSYRREIGESLRSELDYRTEAENIREFASRCKEMQDIVHIPEVIDEFSNEHLITTTWVSGQHISEIHRWSKSTRESYSKTLVDLFIKGIFKWGLLHADPHPGNYRFQDADSRPKVGLLDFGCVKRIPTKLRAGLQDLFRAGLLGEIKKGTSLSLFENMGFNRLSLQPMEDKLEEIANALLEPFTTKGPFDVSNWNMGSRIKQILGSDRMTFRASGPSELIFILRSFQGLIQYLKILDAPVDWRNTTISCLHEPLINQDRKTECLNLESKTTKVMHSETLNIQVLDDGKQKVSLTFGAAATANLPDLVPFELHGQLKARSINLQDIALESQESNYLPGELFSLVEGSKTVRVWLQ